MAKKLTYNFVKRYFKEEGCELLEAEYINSKFKMRYIAQCKHINFVTFDCFKRGRGKLCLKCALVNRDLKRRLTYEGVKDYFKKEECELLEREYINNRIKMDYVAKCGHKYSIIFNSFKNGKGRLCPKCAMKNVGQKNSLSYKYIKDFFKKEGCKLLSKEYINSKIKLKYKTQCIHFHKIKFNNFKAGQGRLCPKCTRKSSALKRKLLYKDVKEYFKKQGCELLSEKYVNSVEKLKYIAECGHFHEIKFNTFRNGQGRICPVCANKRGILKRNFSYKYVKEYFKKEGCKLLEKEYTDRLLKLKYIATCGCENKIVFSNFKNNKQGRVCPKCAIKTNALKQRLSYKYVENYFKINGCKLLSKKYIGSKVKLEYLARCGHENRIIFNSFKTGKGRVCPKCAILLGVNNPSWNPNLTNEDRIKRRHLLENKIWRKNVFERDNYTCHMTGKKGQIIAHHLKPYHKYKDLRFEVSNGITLSEEFHKFVHKIFGYKIEIGPSELVECHYLWGNK